jgi:choline dehydrogenase-like flavoprotein
LSVADASAFPSLTTVNPVVAVLMLAERAAELIARQVAG